MKNSDPMLRVLRADYLRAQRASVRATFLAVYVVLLASCAVCGFIQGCLS